MTGFFFNAEAIVTIMLFSDTSILKQNKTVNCNC